MKCCVPTCGADFHNQKENKNHGDNISQHKFPTNIDARDRWLNSIANSHKNFDKKPKNFNALRICSRHFDQKCFYMINARKRLIKGAIPTVFSQPSNSLCIQDEFLVSDPIELKEDLVRPPLNIIHLNAGSQRTQEHNVFTQSHKGSSEQKEHQRNRISDQSSSQDFRPLKRMKCEESAELFRRVRKRSEINQSSAHFKKVITTLQMQLKDARKRNSALRVQANRMRDKIQILEKTNAELKASQSTHETSQSFLANSNVLVELSKRQKGDAYSDALRTFATTLNFYSSKAYQYVRQVLNNALPHPRSITRWYHSINGEPGITSESLEMLKVKAAEMKEIGQELIVSLTMDEMAIRQQVLWNENTKKLEGIAQCRKQANGQDSDEAPVAKEALVFLVTSIQESWKLPVAYFLINGLNCEEKKEMVLSVLISLHNVGVTVVNFTFDGTKTNIATANALGCNLRTNTPRPFKSNFEHPVSDNNVHVLLDVVHMLKLVRNTLHSQKELHTQNGVVKWEYISKLNEYQNKSGMRLAAKLTNKHVNFENSKMKVLLAVQVISRSVGNALDQIRTFNEDFEGCEATVEFLHMFNDLFDLFNSNMQDDGGFKRPLSADNFDLFLEPFKYAQSYIHQIRLADGTPILQSKYKTGFLGFLVAIESTKNLFTEYCEEKQYLESLPTYRQSQDHVELLFGVIRAKGGCNNNPNASQFQAIYKRLLLHNNLKCSSKANCTDFNDTTLGIANGSYGSDTTAHSEKYIVNQTPEMSHANFEDFRQDEYTISAISMCAADIHKRLVETIKCRACVESLVEDDLKTVKTLSMISEFEFKALTGEKNNINLEKLYGFLISTILENAETNVNDIFENCSFQEACSDEHKQELIKKIVTVYLDKRIQLYTKQMIQFKPTNRQKLTKLILFEGN